MKLKDREYISSCIRHELREGEHTFTMCKCGRHGCRSILCWECWLSILVGGKTERLNFVLNVKDEVKK